MPLYRTDINSSEIASNVRKILTASRQPKVSAILVQAHKNDVTLHVTADSSSRNRSTTGSGQTEQVGSEIPGSAVQHDDGDTEDQKNSAIYMVGSFTKVISNFAMSELLKQADPKIEPDESVNDLVRRLSHQANAGGKEIEHIHGDPSLWQLMHHYNSLAPMNEYCFAPDGTFLWSTEEFFRIAPKITLDYFGNQKRGWFEYSNGNHILLGWIMKNMFPKNMLDATMHSLVFEKCDMVDSTIDPQRLEVLGTNHVIEKGIQVSAEGTHFEVDPNNLMDSAVAAAVGLRSSLRDIANFIRGLLESLHGSKKYNLTKEDMKKFLHGEYSLIGHAPDIYKTELESESPTQYLHLEKDQPKPLGQPKGKLYPVKKTLRTLFRDPPLRAEVHQKAGYVDGFSCSTYLLPRHEAALIVLANSTGPRDAVHHVGRYLLAEILNLPSKDKVVDRAIKEGEANARTLRTLEQKYLVCHNLENLYNKVPDHLVGTYVHTRYEQKIVITATGEVYVGGAEKVSQPMKLMPVSGKENTVGIRMLIDCPCLPIEVWSSWRDMDLFIRETNGRYALLRREGKDVYEKWDGQ